MSVHNSLFLFVSVLALGACGSADADQSDSPAVAAEETTDDATTAAPAPEAPAVDDSAAGEVAGPEKPAVVVAAIEKAPVAAKAPGPKQAKCKITTGGDVLKGPCMFESDETGSFYVDTDKIPRLNEQVESISVTMIEKGKADVRGLTKDGINSRWGGAHRSATDKACWTGSDFEICAY